LLIDGHNFSIVIWWSQISFYESPVNKKIVTINQQLMLANILQLSPIYNHTNKQKLHFQLIRYCFSMWKLFDGTNHVIGYYLGFMNHYINIIKIFRRRISRIINPSKVISWRTLARENHHPSAAIFSANDWWHNKPLKPVAKTWKQIALTWNICRLPILKIYYSEWESDCCLTPMSNFSAISWQEQVIFDEMIMILTQKDIASTSELQMFLNSLEFCNAVVQVCGINICFYCGNL
jgi:hypothetical protein